MNSTFLAIAIPAFGGIIGFSYVHVKVMRKVLFICTVFTFVVSVIHTNFWDFRDEAYYNCLIEAINIPDTIPQKYMSKADIKKELADTLQDDEKLYQIYFRSYYMNKTSDKIHSLIEKDKEDAAFLDYHIKFLIAAFAFSFLLTYLFDYIKKYNLKEGNQKNPNENI